MIDSITLKNDMGKNRSSIEIICTERISQPCKFLFICISGRELCEMCMKFHLSVQSLSCVQLCATPWTAACQASLSITNSQSLLKLSSIESVMPSNHLILCHPLLLLPSIFPIIPTGPPTPDIAQPRRAHQQSSAQKLFLLS